MVTGLPDRRERIAAVAPVRMDVGDHLFGRPLDARPTLVDARQEANVIRCMHGGDGAEAMTLGLCYIVSRALYRPEQAVQTFRHLRVGLRRAAHQELARIMAPLRLGRAKDLHVSLSSTISSNARKSSSRTW